MRRPIKFFLSVGVVWFAATAVVANAQASKIAFLDTQKVLDQAKEGKRVKATLEDFVKTRQKVIDAEEQTLKQMEDELANQGSILSPEAKKVKEDAFQKRLTDYQKRAAEMNQEVQTQKVNALRAFNKQLEEAVNQVATKEGYDYVLDRNADGGAVVYAKTAFDITQKVIEQIDGPASKDASQ